MTLEKETCDFNTQTSAIFLETGKDPSNTQSLQLVEVSMVGSVYGPHTVVQGCWEIWIKWRPFWLLRYTKSDAQSQNSGSLIGLWRLEGLNNYCVLVWLVGF